MKPIILADDPDPEPKGWVVRTVFRQASSWGHTPDARRGTNNSRSLAYIFRDRTTAESVAADGVVRWPVQTWHVEEVRE